VWLSVFFSAAFKSCSAGGKKNFTVYVAVGAVAICIIFVVVGFLWWKGYLKGKKGNCKGEHLDKFHIA